MLCGVAGKCRGSKHKGKGGGMGVKVNRVGRDV